MLVTKEEMRKIIDDAISHTQQEADKYTYPVFVADEKEKPDLIASSVVIKVDGKNYLVTASHVFQEVLKKKSPFLLGANGKYIEIKGEFVYSSDDKDHFDIAFVELSDEFIVENQIVVLDESRLRTHDNFDSVHLALLHGFPNTKNKQSRALRGTTSFKVSGFAYGGVIRDDFDDWEKLGKLPSFHTCMTYTKTKDNNKPISPSGFSGGGLWIVPSVRELDKYYLDSILIEYHKHHSVTFSTKVDRIIEFIKQNA